MCHEIPRELIFTNFAEFSSICENLIPAKINSHKNNNNQRKLIPCIYNDEFELTWLRKQYHDLPLYNCNITDSLCGPWVNLITRISPAKERTNGGWLLVSPNPGGIRNHTFRWLWVASLTAYAYSKKCDNLFVCIAFRLRVWGRR